MGEFQKLFRIMLVARLQRNRLCYDAVRSESTFSSSSFESLWEFGTPPHFPEQQPMPQNLTPHDAVPTSDCGIYESVQATKSNEKCSLQLVLRKDHTRDWRLAFLLRHNMAYLASSDPYMEYIRVALKCGTAEAEVVNVYIP